MRDKIVNRDASGQSNLDTALIGTSSLPVWKMLAVSSSIPGGDRITEDYAQLNVQGPRSRALLATVTSADMSNEAFPFRAARTIDTVGLSYSPSCIRIKAGQSVTWNSAFASHPLSSGTPAGGPQAGSPITVTTSGATRDPVPVDCSPPGVFEESAVKAALRFKYRPRVVDEHGRRRRTVV